MKFLKTVAHLLLQFYKQFVAKEPSWQTVIYNVASQVFLSTVQHSQATSRAALNKQQCILQNVLLTNSLLTVLLWIRILYKHINTLKVIIEKTLKIEIESKSKKKKYKYKTLIEGLFFSFTPIDVLPVIFLYFMLLF